ncbi:unnamed protein product [Fusarium graminearum]|uniref:Chromosome 1, complete genome n=2 Tax=Gibberella zeae TaxID=5518 RepID=I1RFN7_GIBZE|nr:hypothetical protein FGSG_02517 [Fusarium graminearum PH-1]EYB31687.1 hypothetical protein FG05_02517 [Fusarium graminearum]ESU07966.1 hypothetical protein FGSG_02517 [Fusarium graminearum PH-1]CAF3435898.1 unnamed protein product [Fusarium graminearum]CAF3580328.1 unnamed protein product [Fusarium graminearum]CAG1973319.1 unnamed protein product [Fusarium graminearum]|eukprot:XP_011318451.1 hypothetical protein FGSG_02517 [Fusarium graminearum PH-1]
MSDQAIVPSSYSYHLRPAGSEITGSQHKAVSTEACDAIWYHCGGDLFPDEPPEGWDTGRNGICSGQPKANILPPEDLLDSKGLCSGMSGMNQMTKLEGSQQYDAASRQTRLRAAH